jgi:hypothetical protein
LNCEAGLVICGVGRSRSPLRQLQRPMEFTNLG